MSRNIGRTGAAEDDAVNERAGEPGMWRRLEGVLVFDSREHRPMAGARAAVGGPPRLLYRAPGFEIDLQVCLNPRDDRLRLLGQVLDDKFEPCLGLVVLESASGVVSTVLDGCGHFSIGAVTAGWHRMEAQLPHALIVIRSLYL